MVENRPSRSILLRARAADFVFRCARKKPFNFERFETEPEPMRTA